MGYQEWEGLFWLEYSEQIIKWGSGVGGPTGEFFVVSQLRQEKITARMTVSVDWGGLEGGSES